MPEGRGNSCQQHLSGGVHPRKPVDQCQLDPFGMEAWVARFLNLGSSCIYPRDAEQPLKEECLLSGPLEPTNSAYALAKIAGLEMCRHYRAQYGALFHSAMPTNLYGPGDNYHPDNSHVLPALIRRFHEAKEKHLDEVCIWGTGNPRRELLHADDLAEGLLHLLGVEDPPDWVNLGSGKTKQSSNWQS